MMAIIDIMPDHSLVIFTFTQDQAGLTVHNWLQSQTWTPVKESHIEAGAVGELRVYTGFSTGMRRS